MLGRDLRKLVCCLVALSLFSQSQAEDWTYTVRKGETLWGLCFKYTSVPTCWQKIGPYNNVEYPRNLAPGTRIRFPVSWLKEQPARVLVSSVSGLAYKSVPDGNTELINKGDLLTMGTKVSVPSDSMVWLTFADDSVMTVESDTELVLDRLSNFGTSGMVDTRINLRRGSVQTKVIKRQPRHHFEVTTPSSVAAVRGTDFRVTGVADQHLTRSEVFSGEVLVYNSLNEKILPEGKGLLTQKDQAIPEPVTLPAAPAFSDDEETQAMPYQLTWQSIDQAVSYRVEVFDQQTQNLQRLATTSASDIVLRDFDDGCYRIRVSGISAESLQGMPGEKVHCLYQRLAQPVDMSFSSAENDAGSISWSAVAGASEYRLELSKSEDFESLVLSRLLDTPSFDIDGDYRGIFYARVTAVDPHALYGYASQPLKIENRHETKEKSGLMFTMFLMAALLIL